MSTRPKLLFLWLLGASLLLVSCLGTEVKKLGDAADPGGGGTEATDADSFSITIAFREDLNPANSPVVILQGVRGVSSANLVNLCGSSGAACRCTFYAGINDAEPVEGDLLENGISQQNNSFSCELPASLPLGRTVDDYTRVRLSTVDGTKATGFLEIKTQVTLTDVLGSLDATKVRAIYHFGCARTFFEGEGVSPSAVTCPFNQKLGLITASYSLYLFRGNGVSNEADKQSNTFYPTAICDRAALFQELFCDATPQLVFGLYETAGGPFGKSIGLKPQFDDATQATYGYAAEPDNRGNCPLGLVEAHPYVASPPSIIQGSLTPPTNPPSSFVQISQGLLDNTRIDTATPSAFLVRRQPSATACDGTGNCTNATFGGVQVAHSVPYVKHSPKLCVIPPSLVNGI